MCIDKIVCYKASGATREECYIAHVQTGARCDCAGHTVCSQIPAAGDDVFTTSSWPWSVIGPACGLGPPGRTLAAPDARLPPTSFLPHDLRTQKTRLLGS